MTKVQENVWLIANAVAILGFGLALFTLEPEPGDCIGLFHVAEPACEDETVNIQNPEVQNAASYGAALFSFWVILLPEALVSIDCCTELSGVTYTMILGGPACWAGVGVDQ